MDTTDVKVFVANSAAFAASFSHLEDTLKIILLLASIGYTAQKWYFMNKNQKIKED